MYGFIPSGCQIYQFPTAAAAFVKLIMDGTFATTLLSGHILLHPNKMCCEAQRWKIFFLTLISWVHQVGWLLVFVSIHQDGSPSLSTSSRSTVIPFDGIELEDTLPKTSMEAENGPLEEKA